MKKHLALLAIGATFISAPALAVTGDVETQAQDYIEKADSDRNGVVSQSEHQAFASQDPSTAPEFSAADANGDGALTVAEVAAVKQSEEGASSSPADTMGDPNQ